MPRTRFAASVTAATAAALLAGSLGVHGPAAATAVTLAAPDIR